MSWVAAAAAGGAVISGAVASRAADKASGAQVEGADRSIDAQRTQDSLTRLDNAPFMKTGTAANKRLATLLGLSDPNEAPTIDDARAEHLKNHIATYGVGYNADSDMVAKEQQVQQIFARMQAEHAAKAPAPVDPSAGSLLKKFSTEDLNADPVYQSGLKFGLDRGTEGINARATAGGMYDSGATLKALTQFGNDFGSTKANEAFNRFNATNDSTFNKLSGVSGTGQVATGQVAASGANMANNVSNTLEGAGNARAAGIVGGANAWGNAAAGVNNALNNYQSNQNLQALLRRNGGGTPTSNFDYTGYTAAGGNQYG